MIDIGLNIFNIQFDTDRAEVLARAKQSGVKGCVLVGTSFDNIPKVLALACSEPDFLAATAGIHPHASQKTLEHPQRDFLLNTLANLVESRTVLAIGETGLDYQHEYSPRFSQQQLFVWHLELARQTNKPLFLHERQAHSDFVGLIQSVGLPERPGVVHCFTGSEAEARRYLDLGFYLGITGWLTDGRRNENLVGAMKFIPRDRILLETDAPYLTPFVKPSLPRRNEPQYLRFVAEAVSMHWGVPAEEVQAQTQHNTEALFRRRWNYGDV